MCRFSLSLKRPTAFCRSLKFMALHSPASVTGSPFGIWRLPHMPPPRASSRMMIHHAPFEPPKPSLSRVTAAMSERLIPLSIFVLLYV